LSNQYVNSTKFGPKGAAALASAIAVMGSVTCVDVRGNNIAGDGASELSAAVLANTKIEVFNVIPIKEMRADALTELDLKSKGIGVEGGMVVAALLPVMGSMTKILVRSNNLGDKGTITLCDALRESTVSKVQELDLSLNQIGPDGAKAIAALCAVTGSVTKICLQCNIGLNNDAKQLLRDANRKRITPAKLEL